MSEEKSPAAAKPPAETVAKIAIVGGTGALGGGLALRWARAGHDVIIGSRLAEKGAAAAAEFASELGDDASNGSITGSDNISAATAGDIVTLTVPFAHHGDTLAAIKDVVQGKIVIDVTVPLVPPKVRTVQLPPEGSAGKMAQNILGDGVRVVSAFQNVAAAHLREIGRPIDCDVLVCGNDPEAREIVVQLAQEASMIAWHGGRIENSAVAEALTSMLIFINNRYKIDGAGIRLSGIPGSAS